MTAHSDSLFSCPRRVRIKRASEPDCWFATNLGDVCSFCESLSPDAALDLLDRGWPWVETGDRHGGRIGSFDVNLDHFGDGHRQRLVDRLNARRVNIPGGALLSAPFFCIPIA